MNNVMRTIFTKNHTDENAIHGLSNVICGCHPWLEKCHPWMERCHLWMEKCHPWMLSMGGEMSSMDGKMSSMDGSVIHECHPWMENPHPWMIDKDEAIVFCSEFVNYESLLMAASHSESEFDCFLKCSAIKECKYYTWFSLQNEEVRQECLLFSSCDSVDSCSTGQSIF